MKKRAVLLLGIVALVIVPRVVRAADHVDGPRASADPSADITDVFAWMTPDAERLILVMDLVRNADTGARFSDSVQYVFHTTSSPSFGAPASKEETIVCEFDAAQNVKCWAAGEAFVQGDASSPAGLTNDDVTLRVFAGLRNDPFFFNLAGFRETARTVTAAAGSLTFDAAGCPALDDATASALVTQLKSAPGGGPAVDAFANFNVLALVVEVDKDLVTQNGPIVSVSASTRRK
jgi:hypothetical protein